MAISDATIPCVHRDRETMVSFRGCGFAIGPFVYADVLDFKKLQELVEEERINWVVHFSALLSVVGEANIPMAVRVNIDGFHNVIEIAKQYHLKLFVPSTIGTMRPL